MKFFLKKIGLIFLIALFLLPANLRASQTKPWEVLAQQKAPTFRLPALKKQRFANGFRLLHLLDKKSPVIQGSLYLPWGKLHQWGQSPGLSWLTLQALRKAGSGALDPQAFEAKLGALAAKMTVSLSWEYAQINFQCLAEDWKEFLALFKGMLLEPRFEASRLELLKKQAIALKKQEEDQPARLALREFRKQVYGLDSPWAMDASVQDYAKLSLEEVRAFYQERLSFSEAVLGITSPLSGRQLKKDFSFLGDFQNPHFIPKKIPALSKKFTAQNFWLPKELSQANVIIGHLGEKRFNQDKFALLLLNDILGGSSLSSCLGARIRSTLGLAYSVYSSFGFAEDYGLFYVFAQTKVKSAPKVIKEIQKILEDIHEGTILKQEDLDKHRESFLNSLYSSLEPPSAYLSQEARFEFLGYPKSYLKKFRRQIQAVTLEDLKRVAKKYIKVEGLKVLVLGPDSVRNFLDWEVLE